MWDTECCRRHLWEEWQTKEICNWGWVEVLEMLKNEQSELRFQHLSTLGKCGEISVFLNIYNNKRWWIIIINNPTESQYTEIDQSCQTVYRPMGWTLMFMPVRASRNISTFHVPNKHKSDSIIWSPEWFDIEKMKEICSVRFYRQSQMLDVYLNGVSNYRETLLGWGHVCWLVLVL